MLVNYLLILHMISSTYLVLNWGYHNAFLVQNECEFCLHHQWEMLHLLEKQNPAKHIEHMLGAL